jgi:DNA-binding NtrC family response regulator
MTPEILLVFHENHLLEKLKERLKGRRSLLLTATNIEELEKVCTHRVIDVALLDMTQKESNALGLLAILQQKQPEAQVILVSSQDNIAMAIEGVRQGASDEITAPFDIGTLKQKIKTALAKKRAAAKSKKKLVSS